MTDMNILKKLYKWIALTLIALLFGACANSGTGISKKDLNDEPGREGQFKFSTGTLMSTDTLDEWSPIIFDINGVTHMYYLQGTYSRLGDPNALLIHVIKEADGTFTPATLGTNAANGAADVNGVSVSGASLYLNKVTTEMPSCQVIGPVGPTPDLGRLGITLFNTTTSTSVTLNIEGADPRALTTADQFIPSYNAIHGVVMRDQSPYLVFVSNVNGDTSVDAGLCLVQLKTDGVSDGQLVIPATEVDAAADLPLNTDERPPQAVVTAGSIVIPPPPVPPALPTLPTYTKADMILTGIIPFQPDTNSLQEHLIVFGSLGGSTQIYVVPYNSPDYGQLDPGDNTKGYGFYQKEYRPGGDWTAIPLFDDQALNDAAVAADNPGDPMAIFRAIIDNIGINFEFVGLTHIYVESLNIPLPVFTMADPAPGSNANFFFIGTQVGSEATIASLFNGGADDVSPWFEKLPDGDAMLYFASKGRYVGAGGVTSYDLYRANHPTVVELMAQLVDVFIGNLSF